MLLDGLRNLVANLGTSRDKSAGAEYVAGTLNYQQAQAAFEASALARKMVEMPAEDACREWRAWQAEGDQIDRIEEEENRLGLKLKVHDAMVRARLYGGSAIYIGVGDEDVTEPLDAARVKSGGVQHLTVLSSVEVSPGEVERDATADGYGLPRYYTMASNDVGVQIHPSRLVVFHGNRKIGATTDQSQWGDSVLATMMEAARNVDATAANIASMTYEAKVDVIGIPNLMEQLHAQGQTYEKALLDRLQLAMTAKGINGALIRDINEEYDQKTIAFSGLPDVLDGFMQLASAASGIPVSLLFGRSAAGMNATGDLDVRAYYDRVKVRQEMAMTPAMSVLDECLIRSALGDRPKEIHYTWRPLWQPDAKEVAEIGERIANTFSKISGFEALPDEIVGKALVNAMTESGAAPGLEAAAQEYFDGEGDREAVGEDGESFADAEPRTLYVRRDVLNAEEIIAWAKAQGFNSTLPADDMHVTVAFSKSRVDWMKAGAAWDENIEVAKGGPRLMERFGDARVLLFASSHLSWRHKEMKQAGASWDHQEYQPHITISYAADAPDLDQIEPYRGRILLGPEIFEEVNEKWAEGISET